LIFGETKNRRHLATKRIIEEKVGIDNVIITAITKMEILSGAINKKDILHISRKLSRFNIELISPEVTLKSFTLIESYSLSHGLAMPDSMIAATALVMDIPLFTYNTRDYKFIGGLKLYE
jgi:predicted nucleic acid-binding protein